MKNNINWNFDNTYSRLPDPFREKINPVKVKNPELVMLNKSLAEDLNLDFSGLDQAKLSALFSGNELPNNSRSIAQAYAGHQFGHFTMLGDGRAVLIGEHISKSNHRYDIQFKGSGKTAFSRNGDGRAALGPMLREYIISESMHFLNIPTTRSLAVAKTGEKVIRETQLEGAILTRVASSHIRVGTFQYIAARNKKGELEMLFEYVIKRHYPEIESSKNQALDLLNVVLNKQIELVVNWMRVGFIHGVMNTDNMSIAGETIDYGPCAFMDIYDPKTVFSSIDNNGRYSYQNQPAIVIWNLAKFAETLIPLVDEDEEISVKKLTEVLQLAMPSYQEYFYKEFGEKLGLENINNDNSKIIDDYLKILHSESIDFTLSFRNLAKIVDQSLAVEDSVFNKSKDFSVWYRSWKKEINVANVSNQMNLKNPCYIPRNHIVEDALINAVNGDMKEINLIAELLKDPFTEKNGFEKYTLAPSSNEPYITYCGT